MLKDVQAPKFKAARRGGGLGYETQKKEAWGSRSDDWEDCKETRAGRSDHPFTRNRERKYIRMKKGVEVETLRKVVLEGEDASIFKALSMRGWKGNGLGRHRRIEFASKGRDLFRSGFKPEKNQKENSWQNPTAPQIENQANSPDWIMTPSSWKSSK